MRVLLVVLLLSTAMFAQQSEAASAGTSTSAKLTNSDVLLLHRSGLSDDAVSEKIRSSLCDFDTSPKALSDLKSAGVSETVVLDMVRCELKGAPQARSSPPLDESPKVAESASPKGYAVAFIKSERKWRFGFRSEPYNKISQHLQVALVAALEQRGFQQVPALDGECCLLTIELLEVTGHQAFVKKPGVDEAANLIVTDSNKRILYSKGYRGESRAVIDTWGHHIEHAAEQIAKSMADDENLTRILKSGKL